MGEKEWAGLYGGLATTYAGAASPKDNIGGKLNDKISGGAGVVVGYNYVSDNFLLGLEADILTTSMELKNVSGGLSKYVDVNSSSTIRARAGMIFGEDRDYLLYATGGLAVTDIETTLTSFGVISNDSRYVTGFAAGGGIETWLFGNNWITTKLEYLYTSVPSKSYAFTPGQGAAAGVTGPYRFKTGIHQLRSSWNLHF